MRVLKVVVATLLVAGILGGTPSDAGGRKPGKGFWKILVKPKAKWILKNQISEQLHKFVDTIVVETYDVRKVGTADVARLRWTHRMEDNQVNAEALSVTHAGNLTQVAVTAAGIYLLTADMDDAQVEAALKNKPSRSAPPKPYKGTRLNEGRYLTVSDDVVCMGQGPLPDAPDCEDTCEGEVCISATDGVVSLSGNWAPDSFEFVKP